ncbi:hypothetical protein V7S43_015871 [Phytophthora oleae]|uniref:Tubulin-specific chaperone A n=1 Tax=Phytophthora oleae TaxID=2107226 RepID=A0ABD3EXH4_9STRA
MSSEGELRDKEADARVTFAKLRTEQKQAHEVLKSSRHREANMFELAEASISLASGVVKNSHVVGPHLTNCYQQLGELISGVDSATGGFPPHCVPRDKEYGL